MKRIITWVLSTIAVLVLLFGYKTSTSGATPTAATSLAAPASGSSASGSSTGTSSGTSASGSGASAGAGSASTTYTGAVASTRWGDVQVSITVAAGKITDVQVPEYPDNNGRDQEINAQALPTLTAETLSAQSATIDMVSGATVTSDGYLQSLQSALDQAGLA